MLRVVRHPVLMSEEGAAWWKSQQTTLDEVTDSKRKYRREVMPSLATSGWFTRTSVAVEAMQTVTIDDLGRITDDSVYTEEDELCRKRMDYENIEGFVLGGVLSQVGQSIIRRGARSKEFMLSSFDTLGYLHRDQQMIKTVPMMRSYPVERKVYRVIPGEKQKLRIIQCLDRYPHSKRKRKKATKVGKTNSRSKTPATVDLPADATGDAAQDDAFLTFSRRVAIFAEGADYSAVPPVDSDLSNPPKINQMLKVVDGIRKADRSLRRDGQRRIVVFVRWTSGFHLLQYYLAARGHGSVVLTGGQDTRTRKETIRIFQQPTAGKIVLGSDIEEALEQKMSKAELHNLTHAYVLVMSEAGLEGLNLTRPSEVIVMDGFWTPAERMQLEGRFLRHGQLRQVNFHYIEIPGTPDQYMQLAVDQKSVWHDMLTMFELGRISAENAAADESESLIAAWRAMKF
ncbi:hypothetical protein QFC19_008951 [Naganishia cerealis]|uniref:Uncharacterized protein n=1 Tax=Naganishia cerealis TaxID=610337 RepID=A0ACC2UYP2_9TREE|nr:hypothetical protein QFC19_008951 [Naganishia cerealis]